MMQAIEKLVTKLFGSKHDRDVKRIRPIVETINKYYEEYESLTDEQLRDKTDEFRKRLTEGESLDDILPEAFAAVKDACRRLVGQTFDVVGIQSAWDMIPYDVQLIGGVVLHEGKIAEMATGEGKTLVATLAVYLNALDGRGVHLVTVNDYLAKRDSEWMGVIYKFLGLTVGCIQHDQDPQTRREVYLCDITYGTNNEFGFDYLRDNMKSSLEEMVQRGHHYAIVDEVDSILIDEARTPLIISGPTDDKSELYLAIDGFIPQLEDDDFEVDEKARSVALTEDGNEHIEQLLKETGHLEGDSLYDSVNISLVHHVNQALKAHKTFQRDKDYIVRNDKVVIIDEFTGRMMEGRRWSDGLHQAVEAKEKASIQPENQTLASITFQNYFRLYEKLAGMTGTALTEEAEFAEIYKLVVNEVPTNMPISREDMDDELYMTAGEKYKAIVVQIADCVKRGQPVLVGTVSIEKSELLSTLLKDKKYFKDLAKNLRARAADLKDKEADLKKDLEERAAYLSELGEKQTPVTHNVLNARYHEQEAEIVSQAGSPGAVTIATNMAGRGTDIQLGGSVDMEVMKSLEEGDDEQVVAGKRREIEERIASQKTKSIEAGGLFVLATERHESRRIDNQLRGRSGRQGDPGTTKFFLSLEDDLMRIFGSSMEKMLKRFGIQPDESIEHPWFTKAVETAQKKVEQRNYDMRKNVLKFDDVINDQRKAIFEQRVEFMSSDSVDDIISDMREQLIHDLVAEHVPEKSYAEQWDVGGLSKSIETLFGKPIPVADWAKEEGVADTEISERLIEEINKSYAVRATDITAYARTSGMDQPEEFIRRIEKSILLQILDTNWREHLQILDHLRSVVWMRGHAQRDPINEFKTEAFALFEVLIDGLRRDVTRMLMHIQVRAPEESIPQRRVIPMTETHVNASTGANEMAGSGELSQGGNGATRRTRASAGIGTMTGRANTSNIDPNNPDTWGRVPRNAPCPCGTGQKYKHCHGAI